MKKEFISIIGGGWMGQPLSKALLTQDFDILVTTAHDKKTVFNDDALSYTTFDITTENAPQRVLNSDVIIYLIPPLPLDNIKKFFDQISADKKIIFASSTSVYGKNMGEVSEESELSLQQTSSPLLIETENYLRARFKKITILRFGGLYGDKRHPVFFLQGKTDLSGANELTHLVHRDDCLKAMSKIIEKNKWGETFNIISNLRISKKDYYTMMANKLKLTPPCYKISETNVNETKISNEKSKNVLEMNYLNPNEFCTYSE